MDKIMKQLKQPSTWRGLIVILTSLGISISPELTEHLVALAVAGFGAVEVIRNENKKKEEK
ncbi:MAG: hypothetical protein N4A43_02285 [Alphaproteobacteria bacterium]|jgi:hypothetical protein|nr:hypothetical protein [Alphaproteobacteria bacterium]